MNSVMRAVLVTVWIALLSGCAAAVVGGAAGAGYYVGQDERTAAEIARDATITSQVNTKYIGDALVQARLINVDTYRGVVTLYGNVPNQTVVDRAVQLARSVSGVRDVVSKLTTGAN